MKPSESDTVHGPAACSLKNASQHSPNSNSPGIHQPPRTFVNHAETVDRLTFSQCLTPLASESVPRVSAHVIQLESQRPCGTFDDLARDARSAQSQHHVRSIRPLANWEFTQLPSTVSPLSPLSLCRHCTSKPPGGCYHDDRSARPLSRRFKRNQVHAQQHVSITRWCDGANSQPPQRFGPTCDGQWNRARCMQMSSQGSHTMILNPFDDDPSHLELRPRMITDARSLQYCTITSNLIIPSSLIFMFNLFDVCLIPVPRPKVPKPALPLSGPWLYRSSRVERAGSLTVGGPCGHVTDSDVITVQISLHSFPTTLRARGMMMVG
jgi:hypothetical protein